MMAVGSILSITIVPSAPLADAREGSGPRLVRPRQRYDSRIRFPEKYQIRKLA